MILLRKPIDFFFYLFTQSQGTKFYINRAAVFSTVCGIDIPPHKLRLTIIDKTIGLDAHVSISLYSKAYIICPGGTEEKQRNSPSMLHGHHHSSWGDVPRTNTRSCNVWSRSTIFICSKSIWQDFQNKRSLCAWTMQHYCVVHAQGHPPTPMVGQYLASLPTHLQEGVHSCKGYLFLPVLPLVQLALSNTPWRLHQQQLCPSGEQLRKEVGRGGGVRNERRGRSGDVITDGGAAIC